MSFKGGKVHNCNHLPFFIEFIQNSVFPTVLKHAYVTPIHIRKINDTSVQLSTNFGHTNFCEVF